MADATKAWHAVFDKGSKQAQERLKKAHGDKPEFQAFLKSRGAESGERSVKQASTSLKKATQTKVAAQKIADMRFKKALQASSERVREMGRRRREGGEGLGGGLETARDVVAHVKKYGSIKAGRLGEAMDRTQLIGKVAKDVEKKKAAKKIVDRLKTMSYGRGAGLNPAKDMKLNPSSPLKTDMSALSYKRHSMNYEEVQIDEVSKAEAEKVLGGAVKEKPKMPPGKQPAGHRYVRNLARRAMKAGLKNEEVEQVDEASLMRQFRKNENDNAHTENAVLLAKHFGTPEEHNAAKDALEHRNKVGGYDLSNKTDKKHYNVVNDIHKKYFQKLKKPTNEEVEQVVEQDETMEKVEMAQTQLHFICYAANEIIEFVKMGGEVEEWYQNKLSKVHSDMESLHSYIEGEKRRTGMVKEEEEQIDEKAPPGAKFERMVKHIKAGYAKGGLTKQEKGIAYATAWKAYNKAKNEEVETTEETTEQIEEKYMGFKALKASIAAKGGARDPGAVAAAIGRKKYGKEKFQAMAAAGKKLGEEVEQIDERNKENADRRKMMDAERGNKFKSQGHYTPAPTSNQKDDQAHSKMVGRTIRKMSREEVEVVAEAEGKVAVTPKEKALAAHHGDKSKITYGDVIKARIKSAAEKAIKGKE